jgi:hypothetical protein
MTKQEALTKIADLQKFVEELDKPKRIQFKAGDVFAWKSKTGERATVIARDTHQDKFMLGGAFGNLSIPYSGHDPKTKEEMEIYLAEFDYIKIGHIEVVLDKE